MGLNNNDKNAEFEWEKLLRRNDQLATKYFALLRRFSDLPDGDAIIAEKIGDSEETDSNLKSEFSQEMSDEENWLNDFSADASSMFDGGYDDDFMDGWLNDFENESFPEEGLYSDAEEICQSLQKVALGWSNIYASVLPEHARTEGLNVLYYLGRALAHCSFALQNNGEDSKGAKVALIKRSLGLLNDAVGEMQQIQDDYTYLKKMLTTMRNHLLQVRNDIFDYLIKLRKDENEV